MTLVTLTHFDGTIVPYAIDAAFVVRCCTCGVTVATGVGSVQTAGLQHLCADTMSPVREYEITFELPVTEVELPLPLEFTDGG